MTATMLDHQLGYKQETTWNTPVTVDRFVEWLPGNGIDWDPDIAQGAGLRVGAQFDRSTRRYAQVGQANGKLGFELITVGLGPIFEGIFGTAASALVDSPDTTYQQFFTLDVNGTYVNPFTFQEGIVTPGGTVHTYTYAGCSIDEAEFEMPESGICTVTITIDGRSLATGTSLATASYPSGGTLVHSGLPVTGAMTVGGTLTKPTGTALGSIAGGTSVAVKSWKLSIKNNLDVKRRVIGGRNRPTVGRRSAVLSATVEYDSTTGGTFRDAFLAQSGMPILWSADTAEALTTSVAKFQWAAPAAKIDKGPIPMPEDGKTVTTTIDFALLDNDTDAPLYMARRTADATL